MKGIVYKFNPSSAATEEQIRTSKPYALMEKLERGEKPSVEDMSHFSELWYPECYAYGVVRILGWLLDFRPYFRRFLVNDKHCHWHEVYAYNKTMIRKLAVTPSHILEIVELKPKRTR